MFIKSKNYNIEKASRSIESNQKRLESHTKHNLEEHENCFEKKTKPSMDFLVIGEVKTQ